MALEAKLVQKLSQQLLMTPQLQQAIKLLQLGRLEYIEALQKELLENPVLEAASDEEGENAAPSGTEVSIPEPQVESSGNENSKEGKENPIDWNDYLESLADSRGTSTPKGLVNHEDRPSIENTLTRAENLAEHILFQLRMMEIDKREETIALQIIGNLDKNGYLCASYDEIADLSGYPVKDVESVAAKMKLLEPTGVGARNLGECLLWQLEQRGMGEGLAAAIVKNHLDKLERRAFDKIAKIEQVAIDQVYEAVKAIRELEPCPGRPFVDEDSYYIIPDIYVHKVNDDFVITLNEDGMPRLRVSPYYMSLLNSSDGDAGENKNYLHERLRAATWLIKSIHQRQKTIYRVTESIVKFQRGFFEQGIQLLRPLVLKDVADDIGMHESTVSRVTTNKYVHTPHGVFELKFFFSSAIKAGGGDLSSSTVKDKIRTLIGAENSDRPLSDQEIVETLGKDGVQIARRTIAKYRESLSIPSSSRRKKIF